MILSSPYVRRILFSKSSVSCFLRHEYVEKITQKFVSPLIRFTLIWHSVFEVYILSNTPCSIYIKILTWLRGLRFKIANFSPLHCLAIPRRDLSTKKTKPNREKWPESLRVVLEFLTYRTSARVGYYLYCFHVCDFDVITSPSIVQVQLSSRPLKLGFLNSIPGVLLDPTS